MNLRDSLPFRLDPETRERLDKVANVTGLSRGHLIRKALLEYLDRIDTEGNVSHEIKEEPVTYGTKRKK